MMNQPGQDSSMEGILASIKRVIAEDVRPAAGRGAIRPRADIDEHDEDDILELDAPMQVDAMSAMSPVQAPPPSASLVSDNAAEASRNSLAALSALRGAATSTVSPAEGGPLEAVVRDMLRPMLKDWLDQRLPTIVEEIVAKEVARITGKGA